MEVVLYGLVNPDGSMCGYRFYKAYDIAASYRDAYWPKSRVVRLRIKEEISK